jgi:hypothetical protein
MPTVSFFVMPPQTTRDRTERVFASSPLSEENDCDLGFQQAFRKLRSSIDLISWIPPVVLYRSQPRAGLSAESRWAPRTDHEELLMRLNSNDSGETSRFFPGMKMAAMRRFRVLHEAYIQFTAASHIFTSSLMNRRTKPRDTGNLFTCTQSFMFDFKMHYSIA